MLPVNSYTLQFRMSNQREEKDSTLTKKHLLESGIRLFCLCSHLIFPESVFSLLSMEPACDSHSLALSPLPPTPLLHLHALSKKKKKFYMYFTI